MPLPPVEALATITDDACARLRERFAAGNYTDGALSEGESVAAGMPDAARLALVHWTLRKRDDARARLSLLFAYAASVPLASARQDLGDDALESLVTGGVLVREGDASVRSPYRLLPADGMWLLGDDPAGSHDAVMGPGPTTMEIVALLPARCEGAALDVGCGAGTLALSLARRGASPVLGVDLNERAVEVARFNARLNGLASEFRAGDLYAPARGARFSLVVSQPPYVIRPSDTPGVTFLHGGGAGDELAMKVVAGAPAALAPGGRALILFDSAVRPREPLHARVRAALGRADLDLLVLAAPGSTPALQAAAYASLEVPGFGPEYDAAALRYRRHLDAAGIEEVSHALVVLRAPAAGAGGGASFTVTLPARRLARGNGATLAAAFAALDLAARDDAALAAARVRPARGATFVEERAGANPELEPKITVRFGPGAVVPDREISEATYALLCALECADTVAGAVERYAEICRVAPADVRIQVLGFVRENLARGMLEPAPGG